jgi:hypothetical protein
VYEESRVFAPRAKTSAPTTRRRLKSLTTSCVPIRRQMIWAQGPPRLYAPSRPQIVDFD